MSKSRAQRRANRRRAVDRTERVKPSPLAEAKKRPWTMMVLLDRGPEAQGISAEHFEAGIDVAEACEALTRMLGYRAASRGCARASRLGPLPVDVGARSPHDRDLSGL